MHVCGILSRKIGATYRLGGGLTLRKVERRASAQYAGRVNPSSVPACFELIESHMCYSTRPLPLPPKFSAATRALHHLSNIEAAVLECKVAFESVDESSKCGSEVKPLAGIVCR